jgi:hypothetical protein
MNDMSERDLDLHVKILGWLYLISHAAFLVIGVLGFVFFFGIGAVSGDSDAMVVMPILAIVLAGIMALLGLPGMLAGYGLLKKRSWGRVLTIVVGVLGLFNFPIGTLISVYTLWVLLQNSATTYFQPSRA